MNGIFLSSNTQDFIEVPIRTAASCPAGVFLSSNTQDFIEVNARRLKPG